MLLLRHAAHRSRSQVDDIVLRALHLKLSVLCGLTGLYYGLPQLPADLPYLKLLEQAVAVALILTVTLIVKKGLGEGLRYYTRKARRFPATTILVNLSKTAVLLIGILTILHFLGIPIAPVLTTLGVGGIAVALDLQDTLSNLFAGLQILLSRKLRPGDYVRLNSGEEGYVRDIAWQNTTLVYARSQFGSGA